MTKAELIEIFAELVQAKTALMYAEDQCHGHVMEGISLALKVLRRELLK